MEIGTEVLHNVYAQRDTFPVFEVTQMAGHPAIRTKDNRCRDQLHCSGSLLPAKQTFVVDVHVVAAGVGGAVWTGEGAG